MQEFSWGRNIVPLALLFLVSLCFIGGCGGGSTVVVESPTVKKTFQTYTVVEDKSEAVMPELAKATFVDALDADLTADAAFTEGPGLTLTYSFINFDAGNQFGRWFWLGLGNAGAGSLTVQVTFADEVGNQLAKIQCNGDTGSGVFSKGIGDAIKLASKEIATYAKANFK